MFIDKIVKRFKQDGIKGVFSAIASFITKSLPIRYFRLIKSYFYKEKEYDESIVGIFDTSLNSYNNGDYIIMDYCKQQIEETELPKEFFRVSTHAEPSKTEMKQMSKIKTKIVCGTNLLWGEMERYYEWVLPSNLSGYKNMILMGVGWQHYQDKTSKYSKRFYKTLLRKDIIHSVRDEYTKEKLNEIGINNVINTGCPTMWKLTMEHCKQIPKQKASEVITTITDYRQDEDNDKAMLEILRRNYEKVHIWLQGNWDRKYLNRIVNLDDYELIEGELYKYDKLLESKDIDYVGTRLHAGIRALNKKKRSIVVVVDNRAREIAKDTNLIVVERQDVNKGLENLVNSEFETKIQLPTEAIEMWKSQFKR